MKYSLPNGQSYNSQDMNTTNPIEFYKMAQAKTYEMPSYNTVAATSLNNSQRRPLVNPIPSTSKEVKGLTRPKVTYPSSHTQTSYIPNQPEIIYHAPSTHVASMETLDIPTVNNYNMVATELEQSIYHLPAGVPLMPLYGYDSYEESEKDYAYMKQLFPVTAKKILFEVSDECDKLEYEGSCMFDDYPDRVYLSRIVDRIYDKTKHLFEDSVQAAEFDDELNRSRQRRPDKRPSSNNPFKDLIEILFFHEILNRRRRFRGRRQWY